MGLSGGSSTADHFMPRTEAPLIAVASTDVELP